MPEHEIDYWVCSFNLLYPTAKAYYVFSPCVNAYNICYLLKYKGYVCTANMCVWREMEEENEQTIYNQFDTLSSLL